MKTTVLAVALTFAAHAAAQFGGGLPPVPVPPGNPITPNKTLLGKALFFEEQVSATHTVACATCHGIRTGGGSDPRSLFPGSTHPGVDGLFGTRDDIRGSRGVIGKEPSGPYRATPFFGLAEQVTGRRAMTVVNAAFVPEAFWDGRARNAFVDPLTQAVVLPDRAALESQAVGPPLNTVEMAHFGQTWSDVVDRLTGATPLALASNVPAALAQFVANRGYPELFGMAFGTPDITPVRIAMAIATYERTLLAGQSPFDDFRAGNQNALTPQQQRGQQLFFSPQNACGQCHGGPLLTDNRFFYTGCSPSGSSSTSG
jgi:cytochrome c peroxidase